MGDYVSQSDLETRLGTPLLVGLTNADQAATSIDTDALGQAIAEAEAELNGYVGQQYTLPLVAPYPAIVTGLARRMAIYHVYQLSPGTAPQGVIEDYDRAVKTAQKIAEGKLSLGLDTAGNADDTPDSPLSTVLYGGEARRLSRSKMSGF